MEKRWWVLIVVIVTLAAAWLFFRNQPRYAVRENKERLTMQQYLEADGEFISFANAIRGDSPYKEIFRYVIIIDRVYLLARRYKSDHPDDGVMCFGKQIEEMRCYIFTNRRPPQELKELYQYIE